MNAQDKPTMNTVRQLFRVGHTRFIFLLLLPFVLYMANRKSRCDLSVNEKQKLLLQYDNLPKMSQRLAAEKLGVAQSTLNGILKSRAQLGVTTECGGRKRKREGKSQATDEALFIWFQQALLQNAPINRAILMEKANCLAKKLDEEDFRATDGWLTRWKERHGIIYKKLQGEKADADECAAEEWIKTVWPDVLKKFHPNDVYNLDETGLYFRATPDYCMTLKKNPHSAGNKIKERITVALCCNMSGSDKRRPVVIGKSKTPRCFKGVKNIPAEYYSNKSAWMTSVIFEKHLRQWDSKLKRRIALLVDNCPAHPKLTNLKNIELIFLPSNTTSILQPLDQGIIKTYKTFFRSDMRRIIIDAIDAGKGSANDIAKKFTILNAIHMTFSAWNRVSAECITNCFRKGGMCSDSAYSENDNYDENESYGEEFLEWVSVDDELPAYHTMDDGEIAEAVLEGMKKEDDDSTSVGEDDEGDEEEDRIPVKRTEALYAVDVLRRALEENEVGDQYVYFQTLNEIETRLLTALPQKQCLITDFFSKKNL